MKKTLELPQTEERHTQQQRRANMDKELYSITVSQSGYMPNTVYYALGEDQAKNCIQWEVEQFEEYWTEDAEGNITDSYTIHKESEFSYRAEDNEREYGLDWYIQAYRIPEGEDVGPCSWCKQELKTEEVGEIDGDNLICSNCLH